MMQLLEVSIKHIKTYCGHNPGLEAIMEKAMREAYEQGYQAGLHSYNQPHPAITDTHLGSVEKQKESVTFGEAMKGIPL